MRDAIAPRARTVVAGACCSSRLALVPVDRARRSASRYYVTLFTRIMIFALAAVGLNLILGYGGLVSFGHALFLGIGAYAVGILVVSTASTTAGCSSLLRSPSAPSSALLIGAGRACAPAAWRSS